MDGSPPRPTLQLVGVHETPAHPPALSPPPSGALAKAGRTVAGCRPGYPVHASACAALRRLRPSLTGSPDPLDQQLLAAIDRYLEGDLA